MPGHDDLQWPVRELIEALRNGVSPGPLSGFSQGQDLGSLSSAIVAVCVKVVKAMWAMQVTDGESPLRVSAVIAGLGIGDLNSPFARDLQGLLEPERDALVAGDEKKIRALIESVAARTSEHHGQVGGEGDGAAPDGIIKKPDRPSVQMGRPGDAPLVHGKEKKPLTDGQRAVVAALLESGEAGMTKDSLEAVRSGARQILRNLKKDADWDAVIPMPGQTNGRYRIRP